MLINESRLVDAARAGDTEAFARLFKQHYQPMLRLVRRITHSQEDAEDALQETFLKAFRNLNQFQSASHFRTWITRIAINEALMSLRKQRSHPRLLAVSRIDQNGNPRLDEPPGKDADPEQILLQKEIKTVLRNSIRSLSPKCRSIIHLRDLNERSTKETAQLLRISVPAVKSRLTRAHHQLRQVLSVLLKINYPARVRDPAFTTRCRSAFEREDFCSSEVSNLANSNI